MKHFLLMLAVCCLALTATAQAEETTLAGILEPDVPVLEQYPDNPAVDGESPITGLPVSGEAYTPIVITIDGNIASYPHWGVAEADILFQVPNMGGGDTKLMALYSDRFPENAGAVRSARATMVPVAAFFDAAYAFGGMPPINGRANRIDVEMLTRQMGIKSAGKSFNLLGSSFGERVSYASQPINLSAHIRQIHEHLVSTGVSFEARPFRFADAPRTDGTPVSWLKIVHRGLSRKNPANPKSTSTFTWDESLGGYVHHNAEGGLDTDRFTEETLVFANVIVLRCQIKQQTFGENDYLYFVNNYAGSGSAEIFQSGRYVRGAWKRDSETSRLILIGPDGEELALQRGKSFLILTNEVTDVTIR